MEEGRRILAELQQSDWVDQLLDYDTVISGLASGHGPLALARDRPAVGGWRLSEHDSQLLAKLTAVARAPYEAAPWPEPPGVELERLVSDFDRTTGRRLGLQLRWDNLSLIHI